VEKVTAFAAVKEADRLVAVDSDVEVVSLDSVEPADVNDEIEVVTAKDREVALAERDALSVMVGRFEVFAMVGSLLVSLSSPQTPESHGLVEQQPVKGPLAQRK
jgi:hypothetical protein